MADLTTLDPTKPADGDLASAGASRMREERADLIGWSAIEHALTGAHTFKTGDGTFPALPAVPAPGNIGRIFLDTLNGRVLRDDGAVWRYLSNITKALQFSAGPVSLTSTPTGLVPATLVNVPTDGWVLSLGLVTVQSGNAIPANLKFQANGVDIANPGTVSMLSQGPVCVFSVLAPGTSGATFISFMGSTPAGSGSTATSILLLTLVL
jgi:hypothetical protein